MTRPACTTRGSCRKPCFTNDRLSASVSGSAAQGQGTDVLWIGAWDCCLSRAMRDPKAPSDPGRRWRGRQEESRRTGRSLPSRSPCRAKTQLEPRGARNSYSRTAAASNTRAGPGARCPGFGYRPERQEFPPGFPAAAETRCTLDRNSAHEAPLLFVLVLDGEPPIWLLRRHAIRLAINAGGMNQANSQNAAFL